MHFDATLNHCKIVLSYTTCKYKIKQTHNKICSRLYKQKCASKPNGKKTTFFLYLNECYHNSDQYARQKGYTILPLNYNGTVSDFHKPSYAFAFLIHTALQIFGADFLSHRFYCPLPYFWLKILAMLRQSKLRVAQ